MGLIGMTYDSANERLDINASQTTLDVTASSTITGGVDVTINGYTFEVAASGIITDGADVNIVPLMSHNIFSVGGYYHEQVPADFEKTISMKDVTGTVIPTLVKSFSGSTLYVLEGYAVAFNYLFILNDNSVHRISLIDETEDIISYGDDDVYGDLRMTMGDQNTVYVTYFNDDNGTYTARLSKIDFCESTETVINSINEEISYGGVTYTVSDVVYTCKVEYNDIEYIVSCFNCYSDDSSGYRLVFVIYNITEDSVYESNPIAMNESYALDNFNNYTTSPKIHEGKVINTINTRTWDTWPDPEPTTNVFPTFIVDCTDNSITLVNDYAVDTSAVWPDPLWGSGIDHENNYYYFWLEDWTSEINGALMRVNLSTNTTSLITTYSDNVYIVQGLETCYGLKGYDDNTPVMTIPGLSQRGTHRNKYNDWVVDDCNHVIWGYDDDSSPRLYGAQTDLGTPITVDISDWIVSPFDYASSRYMQLFVLAGTAFVIVRSTQISPRLYQLDIYRLAENIPCP